MAGPFNAAAMAHISGMTMPGSVTEENIKECDKEEAERQACCPNDANGTPIKQEQREKCLWCFSIKQCEVFPYQEKGSHCCDAKRGGADGKEGAHHIVPSAMGKCTSAPSGSGGYDADNAKTVCATGFGRELQHGSCHAWLRLLLQDEIRIFEENKNSKVPAATIIVGAINRKNYYTNNKKTNAKGKKLEDICIESVTNTLPLCKDIIKDIGDYTSPGTNVIILNSGHSSYAERLQDETSTSDQNTIKKARDRAYYY